jgi:ribosomal protein L7/L12
MSKKVLENLSEEETGKYEEMALERPIQAIKELKNLTNCSLSEGKVWVDDKRAKHFVENLPPCPYCGEKLRTHLAKQCRFCLRDWHDENELKWLKSS